MTLPIIGVTSTRSHTHPNSELFTISIKYTTALVNAGACPLVIPLDCTEAGLESLFPRLDGVLFTGGGDVHPRHYGDAQSELVKEVDEERDRVEFSLLDKALKTSLPFFGICRGLQVINTGLGGTLYEDMPAQNPALLRHAYYDDYPRDYPAHTVRIESGSRLQRILDTESLAVNSLHHQGIRRLAPGLKATAFAPDGLVEGIELADFPFALAVQWHPEWLQSQPPQQSLLRAFVAAAEKARQPA